MNLNLEPNFDFYSPDQKLEYLKRELIRIGLSDKILLELSLEECRYLVRNKVYGEKIRRFKAEVMLFQSEKDQEILMRMLNNEMYQNILCAEFLKGASRFLLIENFFQLPQEIRIQLFTLIVEKLRSGFTSLDEFNLPEKNTTVQPGALCLIR